MTTPLSHTNIRTPSKLDGMTYALALQEKPSLQLSFFSYGATLRKSVDGAVSEYPVNPALVAQALIGEITFSSGFIPNNVIYHAQKGVKKTVVSFRKRQRTGIWLEGREEALRVPLPDMILIKTTRGGLNPDYKAFATYGKPQNLNVALYNLPLPNIYTGGGICWGSVSRPNNDSLDLSEDWASLLGSAFGNHSCGNKCKSYPDDIRKFLIELHNNPKRRVYPKRELIPAKTTLTNILGIEED